MNFQFLFQAHLQKHTQSCSRCWDDIWTLKTQWKSLQRWRGCICGRQFKDTWLFLLEKKESFLRRSVGCYGYLSKALRIMAHPTSDVRAVDVCVKREGAKPVARIIKCTASTPEALQPVEGSDGVGTLNSALNFPSPSRVKAMNNLNYRWTMVSVSNWCVLFAFCAFCSLVLFLWWEFKGEEWRCLTKPRLESGVLFVQMSCEYSAIVQAAQIRSELVDWTRWVRWIHIAWISSSLVHISFSFCCIFLFWKGIYCTILLRVIIDIIWISMHDMHIDYSQLITYRNICSEKPLNKEL